MLVSDGVEGAFAEQERRYSLSTSSKRKLDNLLSSPGIFSDDAYRPKILRRSSPPSSCDASLLQFFVRTSSGSLVMRAAKTDTVGSVLDRACSSDGIPPDGYRLIYRGRELDHQKQLHECLIVDDASLHLAGRLRSTLHPQSWILANDIVANARTLAASAPGLFSSNHYSFNVHYLDIDNLVGEFISLAPVPANEYCGDENTLKHFQIFIDSGATSALVNIYLSRTPFCRLVAEKVIGLFLCSKMPKFINSCCFNIILEFCNLLAATSGKDDWLYLKCRTSLATLLVRQKMPFFRRSDTKLVRDLLPFLEELMLEAVTALSHDVIGMYADVGSEFSIFLRAIKKAIRGWTGGKFPIPKYLLSTTHPYFEEWIPSLHSLFLRLLESLDAYLCTVERELDPSQSMQVVDLHWESRSDALDIMTDTNIFSKIFKDADGLLHAVLLARRVPVNALLKRARRDEKLCWFLNHKDVIDFEARSNLVLMLFNDGMDDYGAVHEMLIDRPKLLEESFQYIMEAMPNFLRGGIFMEFKNEEASGPGVLREWFYLLCKEIFNPHKILFLQCPNDKRRFLPNNASSVDPLHLKYFIFCGRFIALALMHKVQLGILLDRVFFLQLAGKPVTLEDVKDTDPGFYKSCKDILDMDAEYVDSDGLGLTFVRETMVLGTRHSFDLCPGGNDIVVNSVNREEYVKLLIDHCFVTSISKQVSHFAQGFGDIFPTSKNKDLFFRSLDLEDFNRILGGTASSLSVKEWKEHTLYEGYQAADRQVYWFWQIVEKMSIQQKTALLYFWTSVRYLPIDGFGGLSSKLYLCNNKVSQDHLPSSQTCFYRLTLPPYSSKKVMHKKILFVAQDHISCSFGFC